MEITTNSDLSFFSFQQLSQFCEIQHFVTTRHGGVSSGPYSSLNIGLGTDDDADNVMENRRRLSDAVNIPLGNFVFLNQVHESNVVVVNTAMKGAGAFDKSTAIPKCDAVITNLPEICLFVMGADCVPVLFFDPVKKVIGACHSGWRGTVKKAPQACVQKMISEFECSASDIYVAIGPSIGPCCYEVGSEVIDSVLREFGTTDQYIQFDSITSLPKFDMWTAIEQQMKEIGIDQKKIELANTCTLCNHTIFFSSRKNKGITGRFGAGICLIP